MEREEKARRPRIILNGNNRDENKEKYQRVDYGKRETNSYSSERKERPAYGSSNYGSERKERPSYGSNSSYSGERRERPAYDNRPSYPARENGEYGSRFNNETSREQQPYNTNRPSYNNSNSYNTRNNNTGRSFNNSERPYNNERSYNSERPNNSEQPSYGERTYNNERPNSYGNRIGGNSGEHRPSNRPSYGNTANKGGYQNRERSYGNNNYKGESKYPNKQPRLRSDDYDPNAKYSLKKRILYNEANIDPNEPLRLNKFMANAGVCSRREADELIKSGAVTVNGEVKTELGTKILRSDVVMHNNKQIQIEHKIYVLLNKPKDCVTTADDPLGRLTVMDIVRSACTERIYPVGRLDRNTTGVLLLTNDGDLASKLTHPKFVKKKIYHVFLDRDVSEEDMQRIADGVELEDGVIQADAISYATETDKNQVGIEIHSGKNRVVRRIFEKLGYKVYKLDRVYFAGLTKKNLPRGRWRHLTQQEVNILRMGAFE